MPDESDDTALPGLPTSVAETEPDFGNLLPEEGNQAMRDFEQEFLYGVTGADALDQDAAADDSTQDDVAAQDDESQSDEEHESEEPQGEAQDEAEDQEESKEEETEEEQQEEEIEETAEERLERLERENAELKKRVSGRARKAHPRDVQTQKIAELEQKLQQLTADKIEAERRATLKPYHPDHPDHAKYKIKKDRVKVYNELLNEFGGTEDGSASVARAMVRLGLTDDDVRLAREGEEYEAEQARRFATDPEYRRQMIAKDYEAFRNEESQREAQVAHARRLLEDPHNQELMTKKYPNEFDALWDQGHPLEYIFERLTRMEVQAELKEAKAAKNRVKASADAKKKMDRKKATGATEVNTPSDKGPVYATDLADAVEAAYEKQQGRKFDIDRADCQRFLDEFLSGANIIK